MPERPTTATPGAGTGPGPAPPARAGRARAMLFSLVDELPALRFSLAISVALGMVSTAAVVVQAVALARLLASAMPAARAGDRLYWFVLLGGAVAVRSLVALAGEVVAGLGASWAKAELRARLVPAAVSLAPLSRPAGPSFATRADMPRASAPGAVPYVATPGDVATLAGPGLDALDLYLGHCLPDFVLAALAPLAMLVAVGVLDWLSALVLAVVVALFPVFGTLVGRASMALASERWRQVEALGRQVADLFQGLPVLRAFGRSAEQRERIARANEALRLSSLKTLRVAFLSALVLDTLGSISVALVAVPLGLRLLDGSVHLWAALAVLVVAPEVFLPLRRASAEFHESTQGLVAASQALAVIADGQAQAAAVAVDRSVRSGPVGRVPAGAGPVRSVPAGPRLSDDEGARVPDPREVPVALRSVRVDLPGREEPVLEGACLVIEPGEKVLLVGPSGSGKSTVLALLLGFVGPSRGSVTVGDLDLATLDPREWRRSLTYLPEHPTLLPGTLAANLRLANPVAGDGELARALAQVGAAALAEMGPAGLEARVGEGGRPLSAGELQRVALARAVLRRSPMYLLDEPTAHLDQAGEDVVLEGLAGALRGSSALIVSHRPALARLADRAVALRQGRFVPVAREDLAVRQAPAGAALA